MLRAMPFLLTAFLSLFLMGCVDHFDTSDASLSLATPKGYAPAVAIAAPSTRSWQEKALAADKLGAAAEEEDPPVVVAAKPISMPTAKRRAASYKPRRRSHRRRRH